MRDLCRVMNFFVVAMVGPIYDACSAKYSELASNARANAIIAHYATLHDGYDEVTDHGRTRSAYICDLING